MTVSDGDYLRVAANFELPNGTMYQNIYYLTRDGTDPYSDAAHVTAIQTWIEGAYANLVAEVNSGVVEQLSFVDRLEWDGTKFAVVENIGTFTPAFVPTGAGDQLPHQSAPFVIFKTLRPRSVGKKFLFPFQESVQNAGILTAGAVTNMVAYAADILATINLGGDATLTAGIVRTAVNGWLTFLVAVANDIIGTQRRRRPGVGA